MSPESKKPKWTWVDSATGQPKVRWKWVLLYAALLVAFQLAVYFGMQWFLGGSLRLGLPLAMLFPMLAGLTVMVELQRQAVYAGKPCFRLGMAASLLVMFLLSGFFAAVGNELRATQQAHAANQKLRTELEQIINGGAAYVSSLDGRGITCSVTRKTFSDADLRRVIEKTSQRGSGRCGISHLFLDSTAVTNEGLLELRACTDLEFLSLATQTLDDDVLTALSSCQKLKHLFLNEKTLTAAQLTRLEKALPQVQLNGNSWKMRANLKRATR